MGSDPRTNKAEDIVAALRILASDTAFRAQLLSLLKKFEQTQPVSLEIRERVTGQICDALFTEVDELQLMLENGLRFSFLYRTKIARDIVLREKVNPTHLWEPQTTKLLVQIANMTPGDVLIGGAYFGDHAVILAHAIDPSRLVHAFEPNGDQRIMLQKNATVNLLTNLITYQKVLWSVTGLKFQFEGYDSFASVVEAEETSGIESISIDDYWPESRPLGLIHLDVEGAELEILKGGLRSIKKNIPFVIFEIHRSYVDWDSGLEQTAIVRFLLDIGYTLFAVRDINSHFEMRSQIEVIPANDVYLDGPPHGFNMLAVPPSTSVEALNCKIVRGVSPKLLPHKSSILHHPTDGSWA